MQDFTSLRVWQASHRLCLDVYAAARGFPHEEIFGLTSQLRKSVSSIGANIAESCGYRGGADSARFIQIAIGSVCETDNHLMVARDLGYLTPDGYSTLAASLTSVRRMLITLVKRMRG